MSGVYMCLRCKVDHDISMVSDEHPLFGSEAIEEASRRMLTFDPSIVEAKINKALSSRWDRFVNRVSRFFARVFP